MFFFFQAEDGIRDIGVTGVQTCALPIYGAGKTTTLETCEGYRKPQQGTVRVLGLDPQADRRRLLQIGRASCRERGVDLGGRRIIKKKKQDPSNNSITRLIPAAASPLITK